MSKWKEVFVPPLSAGARSAVWRAGVCCSCSICRERGDGSGSVIEGAAGPGVAGGAGGGGGGGGCPRGGGRGCWVWGGRWGGGGGGGGGGEGRKGGGPRGEVSRHP